MNLLVRPLMVVPRRLIGLGVGVGGVLCVWWGIWPAALGLLAVAAGVVMAPSAWSAGTTGIPRDLMSVLPVGFVVVLAAGVAASVSAGLLKLSIATDTTARSMFTVAFVALMGLILRRPDPIAVASGLSAVAWVPAIVVGVVHGLPLLGPVTEWSRPMWGMTDWINHGEMVVEILVAGGLRLDPSDLDRGGEVAGYPRGLHSTLGLILRAFADLSSPALVWTAVLAAVALAMVGAVVVVLASTGLAAGILAHRAGLTAPVIAAAVLVGEALVLHPLWFQSLARLGFLTSAWAVVILLAQWVAVMVLRGRPLAMIAATLLGAVTLGYLWQPLAVSGLALAAWLTLRFRPATAVGPLVAMWGVSFLALVPITVASVALLEVDTAVLAGITPTVPLWWAMVTPALAVVAVFTLLRRWASAGGAWLILVGSLVLLAIVLWGVQATLTRGNSYYAGKVLWMAGVLSISVVVPATLVALRRAVRWMAAAPSPGRSMRLAVVAVPTTLALAGVSGWLSSGWTASVSDLSRRGGSVPPTALEVLDDPRVVAAGKDGLLVFGLGAEQRSPWSGFPDWHATQLLRPFGVRGPTGAALLRQQEDSLCAWLRDHPEAVRVTGVRRGERDLLAAGCPQDVVRPEAWIHMPSGA